MGKRQFLVRWCEQRSVWNWFTRDSYTSVRGCLSGEFLSNVWPVWLSLRVRTNSRRLSRSFSLDQQFVKVISVSWMDRRNSNTLPSNTLRSRSCWSREIEQSDRPSGLQPKSLVVLERSQCTQSCGFWSCTGSALAHDEAHNLWKFRSPCHDCPPVVWWGLVLDDWPMSVFGG